MARAEHGTWIGISKTGRLCVLLNLHESADKKHIGEVSRGLFTKEFLRSDLDPKEWIEKEHSKYGEEVLARAGGFTMFCGVIRRKTRHGNNESSKDDGEFPGIDPFYLLSNRVKTNGLEIFGESASLDSKNIVEKDCESSNTSENGSTKENGPDLDYSSISGKTVSISNTPVTEPWPKVKMAISALDKVIEESVKSKLSESELIQKLVQVLNTDTYPKDTNVQSEDGEASAIVPADDPFDNLKHSVFIPPLCVNRSKNENNNTTENSNEHKVKLTEKQNNSDISISSARNDTKDNDNGSNGPGNYYGTRTNTIILVSKSGHVKYIERSLHTTDSVLEEGGVKEVVHEFDIQGF